MLLLETDPIALWSLVVAIISGVIALVAAVAAIYAAVYAKAAPTRVDLARVEQNTAHLEEVKSKLTRMDERQRNQHEHDALVAKANNTSFMIRGAADIGESLNVSITATRDNLVVFSRVELVNENGNRFGAAQCQRTETPEQVIFTLDGETVKNWINAGTPVRNLANDKVLYLRVYMLFKGYEEEVYRFVTVTQSTESRQLSQRPGHFVTVYRLNGTV